MADSVVSSSVNVGTDAIGAAAVAPPPRRTAALLEQVSGEAVIVICGSLLVALCAQVRFVLPFTVVPITGQTFAVLLLPVLLRGWRGPAAVGLYLVQASAGLPFFAGGGAGLAVLGGPTGGYLVGFLVAAGVVAVLTRDDGNTGHQRLRLTLAMVAGTAVIYLFGLAWLARFVDGGLGAAVALGMTPFLVGDAVKVAAAVAIAGGSARRSARKSAPNAGS